MMPLRLLDLFCCQGGAGEGYRRAGFDITGVDIEPQPRNPHRFIQADALAFLAEHGHKFDAIHASPPCQAFTKAQRLQANEHPNLIAPVRVTLRRLGVPYVIENVEGAPLIDPIMLCGTMFGLRLYRHRLFECSFPVAEPLHGQHWLRQVKMGRKAGPQDILQPVGNFTGVDEARDAMGMPWANRDGLREAVPPAYTEHIGGYLLAAVTTRLDVAA
jgi:DNA (cytosine-5)-methyltransferase 1